MKEKFIKFLKDNDALIPFICNLATLNTPMAPEVKGCLFRFISKTQPDDLIDHAFRWDKTSEGVVYWNSLEKLWWRTMDEM
jgi:hypothetical protein